MGNEGSQPVQYGDQLENDINIIWDKPTKDNSFSGREAHCSCSVGGILYTFGGLTLSGDDGLESNELLAYDTDKDEWSSVSVTGTIPRPRTASAMASMDKHIYLFGGLSNEIGWLNDLHIFNTESSEWTKVTAEGVTPSARDKLACTVIEDKIYFFGGFGPKAAEEIPEIEQEDDEDDEEEQQEGAEFGWFNDLFIFDTSCNKWSSPMQMNLGVPTPRAAHGMCAIDKHLLIFGGRDTEMRRNDLHIFDTETRKWVTDLEKSVRGRQPEPRSFHSATAVGQRMVICGGRGLSNQHFNDFHIFDFETKEWLQPQVEGELPTGRGCHTATIVQDKLIIFGGSSDFNPEINVCNVFHNDLYSVNTGDVKSGKSLPKSPIENQENIPVKESTNNSNKSDADTVKPHSKNVLGSVSNSMETSH